jgi:hypothetical protein
LGVPTNSAIDEEKNWLERIIFSQISHGEIGDASGPVEEMIDEAARRGFQISTALGLVPGPLGMATILPEVAVLARLQINLIRRIALHHGKENKVNKELVLLIMANATGVAAGEIMLRRVGTTLVLKSVNTRVIRAMARKVGTGMVDLAVKRAIGRWIPLVTAPLFGHFSRSLTRRIGKEADKLFLGGIDMETTGTVS